MVHGIYLLYSYWIFNRSHIIKTLTTY